MQNSILWIADAIHANAETQNRDVQTIKWGESMSTEVLAGLKAEMQSRGWKVNKRGESLILTKQAA